LHRDSQEAQRERAAPQRHQAKNYQKSLLIARNILTARRLFYHLTPYFVYMTPLPHYYFVILQANCYWYSYPWLRNYNQNK